MLLSLECLRLIYFVLSKFNMGLVLPHLSAIRSFGSAFQAITVASASVNASCMLSATEEARAREGDWAYADCGTPRGAPFKSEAR